MRIILADHHTTTLWALRTMLQEQPEFDLIGEAENAVTLLSLACKRSADLVLVDMDLPGAGFEALVTALRELEPRPVVMAMSSKSEYRKMLLRIGADAFVSKGDHPEWLLANLHKHAQRTRNREWPE